MPHPHSPHSDPGSQELMTLLRRLAQERGLIILTDSDGAGFVIRNYLKGAIDPSQVKHAYIPDVAGKEKRKRTPGKEGKLGVEGMTPAVLEEALRRAGATVENEGSSAPKTPITKADMMRWGLTGFPDSAVRRQKLMEKLELPSHMSTNALLEVLNALYSKEELEPEEE